MTVEEDASLHQAIMANADRLIEVFNEAKVRPAGPERDGFLARVVLAMMRS